MSKHSENPERSIKCANDQKKGTNWFHNDQDNTEKKSEELEMQKK